MRLALNVMLALAVAIMPSWVLAQARAYAIIVGTVPAARTHLQVFTQVGNDQSSEMVAVPKLDFPIEVEGEKDGYLSFRMDGKLVWVKRSHVRLQRLDTPSSSGFLHELFKPSPSERMPRGGAPGVTDLGASGESPPQHEHPSGWSVPAGKSPESPGEP